MKKLMIILVLGSSLLAYSQEHEKRQKLTADFSPEQHAVLQTKKMALDLDLNENQQQQMLDVNKKWAKIKADKKTAMQTKDKADLSADERFDLLNKSLDQRLAHQQEVKKILNEDQYKSWKRSSKMRHHRSKGRMGHQHKRNRNG